MYLWQGGFDPVAGIIAAALVIAVGGPPFLEGIRLTDLDGRPVSLDDLAGFLERDLGIDAERERTSLAR
ncbi:hypothetical protein [Allosphingosinicella humi]